MKKIVEYIVLTLTLLMVMTSCQDEPEPKPEPEPTAVDRTILVYMAADNNLGSNHYDTSDINEMIIGASTGILGNNRLIVYHSAYRRTPVLMEIKDKIIDTLAVYEYGTVASTQSRMEDVIATTMKLAPAESYGLILWGHGTGWLQDGIDGNKGTSYSYGPENGQSMNISTLAEILETAGRFDYVYFDCCYMSSIETIYEMRNATRYIIGSPTELKTDGMPYHTNLPYLLSGTKEDLIKAAGSTFELYDKMSGSQRTCTMSVLDMQHVSELASITAEIYSYCTAYSVPDYSPQRYSDYSVPRCYYFDFKDYVEALMSHYNVPEELKERFEQTFDNVVLYSVATPKLWNAIDLTRANGLSTFILSQQSDITVKNYKTLSWYNDVVTSFSVKH